MKAGTFNISATEAESYWSPGVKVKVRTISVLIGLDFLVFQAP